MYGISVTPGQSLTLQEYAEAISVLWTHIMDWKTLAYVSERVGPFTADDVAAAHIEVDCALVEEV